MNFFVKVKTYTWCSKVEVLSLTTKDNVKTHNVKTHNVKNTLKKNN
jgi:hypothetical protein